MTATKPLTKKERRMARALRLSLRNNPPKKPNAMPSRKQRRLAARLGMGPQPVVAVDWSAFSVAELKAEMKRRGATGYSKLPKPELIRCLTLDDKIKAESR